MSQQDEAAELALFLAASNEAAINQTLANTFQGGVRPNDAIKFTRTDPRVFLQQMGGRVPPPNRQRPPQPYPQQSYPPQYQQPPQINPAQLVNNYAQSYGHPNNGYQQPVDNGMDAGALGQIPSNLANNISLIPFPKDEHGNPVIPPEYKEAMERQQNAQNAYAQNPSGMTDTSSFQIPNYGNPVAPSAASTTLDGKVDFLINEVKALKRLINKLIKEVKNEKGEKSEKVLNVKAGSVILEEETSKTETLNEDNS